MDRIALRYWPLRHWLQCVGVLAAALLLAALLSFHLQDPTLTNLRQPSGGVANLLGLPGALIAGSLLEFLGSAALLAPLLVLNWALVPAGRPSLPRYLGRCTALLVAASGLHALALPSGDPGLLDPGLAGWALRHWVLLTTGPWAGAAVLGYLGLFALARVLYAPVVATAVRDARVFGGWFLRTGWRQSYTGLRGLRAGAGSMHRVAGAAALGLTRRARMGLGGLLRLALHPPRLLGAWLAELRTPSLAGIKARAGEDGTGDSHRRRATTPGTAAMKTADGFDQWYQAPAPLAPGLNEPAAALTPAPDGSPPAKPPREPAPWLRPLRPLDGDGEERPERLRSTGQPAAASAPDAETNAHQAPTPAIRPPVLPQAPAPSAEADADSGGFAFEQPEAEAAWRQRFQRYARNLDLDWEEQLWRGPEEDEPTARAAPRADEGEP